MKFLSNFSFRKLFSNKRFTIPFSVLLSFIIWLMISINQKPNMDRTFADVTVSINLENTYVAENKMSIIGDISQQKFTVVVRGPSYLVSALTSNDFSLYASAAEVDAPGEYNLQVSATKASNNAEYEIMSITPSTIGVNFDYIETKEFTIEALAEGAVAAEGLIAETGVVGGTEKDTVTIEGPRTTINAIEKVVALASVNKTLESSETFDASIVLYDADGNTIDPKNLTLSSTNVKVTVPISKKKTIPVIVEFSNLPSNFDKSTLSCTIDHPTVTVIGKPDTVDKITQISLSPIDISAVSLNASSFDVSAKLPEGVRLLDNIEVFTVSIDLSGYIEKTFTVETVKNTGLSSSLTVSGTDTIRNVKIIGPKSAVNKISAEDISATLNLTDKKAGEHSVAATFSIDGYNNVWAVGTYNTTVTIK